MIRGKIFMKIVTLISLCDAMGNWPYALNYYPAARTPLCRFEGFCNLYFFPCSWLLTTFLVQLFRDLTVSCKIMISLRTVLIVSMGLPLLFALLQLSVGTFGTEDDGQAQPCSFGGDFEASYWWHIITYDGLLYLCFLIMFKNLVEVLWLEYTNAINSKNTDVYSLMKRVLMLYPVAIFVCWMPHAVCICIPACFYSVTTQGPITGIKILHGGCVAIIFFTMSSEARRQWAHFFRNLFSKTGLIRTTETRETSLWSPQTETHVGFGRITDKDLTASLCEQDDTAAMDTLPDDEQLTALLMRVPEVSAVDSRPTGIAITDTNYRPSAFNSPFR
jgi:hypothetical protein